MLLRMLSFLRGLLKLLVVCAAALALQGCSPDDNSLADASPRIDYNWHVRPILSDACFSCHGPDSGSREAGLRLDLADTALAELPETPGRFAIVPGEPDESELIRRITSVDPDVRMPPEEAHKPLQDAQIATLRQWIEEGATYKDHWAFIPPSRPDVPEMATGEKANAIDNFVLARLQQEGLSPAAQADRETLAHRVSLSLTGLPLPLPQVDAFINDTSPDAYSSLVSRLLDSPAYAEHMATLWMDLARWSESDGFLFDHHDRLLWPWRDWVIAAFDNNMPFDQFITWQLAGDLLPDPTREQLLATTYVRLGKRTTENGAIEPEYKAEYMIERTDNALGVGLMGLTLGCARCHDHKYDPISQVDYYSLGAFFNSIDEPGFYAPGHSAVQGGPTLPWPSEQQQTQIAAAEIELGQAEDAHRSALNEALAKAESADLSLDSLVSALQRSVTEELAAYYSFDSTRPVTLEELPPADPRPIPPIELVSRPYRSGEIPGRNQEDLRNRIPANYLLEEMQFSDAVAGDALPAILQSPQLKDGHKGKAMFFNENNKGFLGKKIGWYDRGQPFSFDFWYFVGAEYPEMVPVINHRDDDNSGGSGFRVQLEDGHLWYYIAHSRPANMIAIRTVEKIPVGEWVHMTLTYDGSSTAAGTKIFLNGRQADVVVDHDTLSRSILPYGYSGALDRHNGLSFGTQFREKSPVGSGIDEFRVYTKALTTLEVEYLHDGLQGRLRENQASLPASAAFVAAGDEQVKQTLATLTGIRQRHNDLVSLVPQVLIMGDSPQPVATHVLNRGVYDQPGQQVFPKGMDHILAWDDALPQNRLGLARWLTDPRHPLTARVFVNRMWQYHFGRGIVETAGDFGAQGAIPSHPELLDWLALEFIESGWDIKHLNRLIVESSTFRQVSNFTPSLLDKDPQNILLARGPRWRMQAETVRDTALANAGLLSDSVGGPSAYPYQPEGVWNSQNSSYVYPAPHQVPQDEHHRRTLYTFVKRSALHPFLQNFDFADRNSSVPQRRPSSTPLQALSLMNDPQFIEASRVLASRVLMDPLLLSDEDRLKVLYRIVARRTPGAEQTALLHDYYQSQKTVFASDPQKAEALLSTGIVDAADDGPDAGELAALANVAMLIMNSPDAYTIW